MWKRSPKWNCHLVIFFYPLFSSVGTYSKLTSVASSGALSNVTSICQTCGVCLCEYLLGVLQRLGSWLSFVIWKSIKEDFCQIRDFHTLLYTNCSRLTSHILLLRQRPASWGTEKQKYSETRLAWDTWTSCVSWGLVGNSTLWWSETALSSHAVRVQGHFIQEQGKIAWNLSLQNLSKTDNPDTSRCGWQLTFSWSSVIIRLLGKADQ